jgi:flagellar protein FlaJ
MKANGIREGLSKSYKRFEDALRQKLAFFLHRLGDASTKVGDEPSKPQVFAYRLLGEKTAKFLPLFKDLDVNLQKSAIKMSFKGYVSLAILMALLASVSVAFVFPLAVSLLLRLSLILTLLYTAGATLFAGAFSIIGFYIYPIIKADSRKRSLEDELPFTTGYLSILAGAGVPPAQMFRSLAKIDSSLATSQEAKQIVRDVELFGIDVISAMESASKRTPSEKFRELLEGFIATMHGGGDLTKYLSERSQQFMRLKKIALRRLGDTLGVLAEFYVVILVAGPLMLVVMLAVMAMLGGGIQGLFNPRLMLYLLTYMGIPLGSTIFLIMLDMVSPKR